MEFQKVEKVVDPIEGVCPRKMELPEAEVAVLDLLEGVCLPGVEVPEAEVVLRLVDLGECCCLALLWGLGKVFCPSPSHPGLPLFWPCLRSPLTKAVSLCFKCIDCSLLFSPKACVHVLFCSYIYLIVCLY